MKKNLFILFILVSMLFPGCENELPYMNKPQVPQLLMNAFLEAGKEENGVSLRMIDTDKQQADCVSNGSIVVYVNGQKTETAEVEKVYGSFDDSNCTLKTSFRPGDRIRFEATGWLRGGNPFSDRGNYPCRYAPYAIEGWFQYDGLYAIQDNDT